MWLLYYETDNDTSFAAYCVYCAVRGPEKIFSGPFYFLVGRDGGENWYHCVDLKMPNMDICSDRQSQK